MPIKGIILFIFLVGSLPVCFLRPFYGILLWMVISFANPQSALFYWSTANNFPWAVAVAVPTLIGFALFENDRSNLRSGKVLLLAILWAWFTVTTIVSTHMPEFLHHADDTWWHWSFVSKVLLMTAVTIAMLSSMERMRTFVLVMGGCFGFFVLKSFPFIILTGGAFRLYGPEFSMIADNNDFGLALNMTLPVYFFLAQTEERRWARLLCWFLFLITIPAIFFTYSRGALVGLIVVLFLMLLRSRQRLFLIPAIAFGLAVALLFAPEAWKHRMDPTRSDAIDGSALSRLNAWSFSWGLAKDYPIAGGGFGTFTRQLFDIYAPGTSDIHGPHSVYFQVLGEHGFVGLGLYLALIGACFLTLFRLQRYAKNYDDPMILAYSNMFRFSLIGFLTSGIFLGRAYFDYAFTLVACVIALEKIALRRWAEVEDEAEEETPALGEAVLLPDSGGAR